MLGIKIISPKMLVYLNYGKYNKMRTTRHPIGPQKTHNRTLKSPFLVLLEAKNILITSFITEKQMLPFEPKMLSFKIRKKLELCLLSLEMADDWHPHKTDLIISSAVAVFYPFLAGFLFDKTGALLPMAIYYGLAWGLVIWRRKETGYVKKFSKPPLSFYINVATIILCVIFAYFGRIEHPESKTRGVLLTAFIWAPINAASEQLLWIYIFESWDLYQPPGSDGITEKTSNNARKMRTVVGLIFFTVFVGLIHTSFWVKFLHTVDPSLTFGIIFVLLSTITGFLHIIVWRQSHQMFYTFIPHFILNFIPTFFTGYSMVPYLLN